MNEKEAAKKEGIVIIAFSILLLTTILLACLNLNKRFGENFTTYDPKVEVHALAYCDEHSSYQRGAYYSSEDCIDFSIDLNVFIIPFFLVVFYGFLRSIGLVKRFFSFEKKISQILLNEANQVNPDS